jgi:hypothetical protein
MPLAPAKTLSERFPAALAEVLAALEVDSAFIANEIARMTEPVFSKTANRSVERATIFPTENCLHF